MRALLLSGCVSLAALSGCGLENLFSNVGHKAYDRPASRISGAAPAGATQIWVADGAGNVLKPFRVSVEKGRYELRLDSSRYAMLVVHVRLGDMELRALVPSLEKESSADGVNLDARGMTEMLIVEARLSADSQTLKQVTPATYLATRALIRQDMDQPRTAVYQPTQDLLRMVESVIARNDPAASQADPYFFRVPALKPDFTPNTGSACGLGSGVLCSPLDAGWLARNPFDYDGVPGAESDSAKFDAKLGAVAQLYRPAGCPDPDRIRLMFTVDFSQGALNGNGGAVDRFKWATDKPGKSMFFVGWVYTGGTAGIAKSDIDTPDLRRVFDSTPNVTPMYDDGTNGDEVAGDGIWTIFFDVPRSAPGRVLRLGYKYTWATFGAPWTGSEEWPGNGRILEVVDANGDEFVYRRDVFGDEATNKDNSNLSRYGTGSIDFTTDLRGCGYPESHENRFVLHDASLCGATWHTPASVGPLTIACQ
jgi:hypothetical protein